MCVCVCLRACVGVLRMAVCTHRALSSRSFTVQVIQPKSKHDPSARGLGLSRTSSSHTYSSVGDGGGSGNPSQATGVLHAHGRGRKQWHSGQANVGGDSNTRTLSFGSGAMPVLIGSPPHQRAMGHSGGSGSGGGGGNNSVLVTGGKVGVQGGGGGATGTHGGASIDAMGDSGGDAGDSGVAGGAGVPLAPRARLGRLATTVSFDANRAPAGATLLSQPTSPMGHVRISFVNAAATDNSGGGGGGRGGEVGAEADSVGPVPGLSNRCVAAMLCCVVPASCCAVVPASCCDVPVSCCAVLCLRRAAVLLHLPCESHHGAPLLVVTLLGGIGGIPWL